MGYRSVSDNKPSPVALYLKIIQLIVFIENVWNPKYWSILNLNMPTFKWDDAEEPTIDFYNIGNR